MRSWKNYDYHIGQCILKYDNTIKGNLAIETSGPFENVCVHMNGIVTIQLWVSVTEQIIIHIALSLVETLCYDWRFSYSGRMCSAHEKRYMSSCLFIPGNPDILYSPKWLLFTTQLLVVWQSTDRW